jgi:hypothetical protein
VQCKAVFDFGTGSRNTVAWAPHGRFLVLGGFGNIAGHIELWDNNKKKQLAVVKAPGTTNWSRRRPRVAQTETCPRICAACERVRGGACVRVLMSGCLFATWSGDFRPPVFFF